MNSKEQHIRPDEKLMARLHKACSVSRNGGAFEMREREGGDYLVEPRATVRKRSTLGASINYSPSNA
ncbi:hypothetical protein [Aurantiacibacter zhengii]|uniref:Uncharacterized protein n=1 Tax=Aurantiacibacter zhengii TaxID=2307003 RepID=A0A418NXE5_9SPHN|nr:hypothetical protein [Aurantiacibacter zhengii]RIV89279.1 hypothetical protein D2V07_03315 [Aurantiacibacter zhengii]